MLFFHVFVSLLVLSSAATANAHEEPQEDTGLNTGADLSDCRSALHLGPSNCSTVSSGTVPVPQHAAVGRSSGSELQIDDAIDRYLESYGKPPREAVRALLLPTDENIRAYLRRQEQTLALTGYVAARMTELKNEESPRMAGNLPDAAQRAGFLQIRIWLVKSPRDLDAAGALRALSALARQVPALQLGVKLASHLSSVQLQEQIAAIDPALSVAVVEPESVDHRQLPFIQVEDLRSGKSLVFDARGVTAEQLLASIAAVRFAPTIMEQAVSQGTIPGEHR